MEVFSFFLASYFYMFLLINYGQEYVGLGRTIETNPDLKDSIEYLASMEACPAVKIVIDRSEMMKNSSLHS